MTLNLWLSMGEGWYKAIITGLYSENLCGCWCVALDTLRLAYVPGSVVVQEVKGVCGGEGGVMYRGV